MQTEVEKPSKPNDFEDEVILEFGDVIEMFEKSSADNSADNSPVADGNGILPRGERKENSRELSILLEEVKTFIAFDSDDDQSNPLGTGRDEELFRDEVRKLLYDIRRLRSNDSDNIDGEIGARFRSYERRIRELNISLSVEKKLRKRAELLSREALERLGHSDLDGEERMAALHASGEKITELESVITRQEHELLISRKEKGRLQRTLEAVRDDFLDAHHSAQKHALEADYHRRRAISLEVKGTQDKRIQMALQLRVQELQQVQHEILEEMHKAKDSTTVFNATATKARLTKLSKKRSEIMSRIANLVLRGKHRSDARQDDETDDKSVKVDSKEVMKGNAEEKEIDVSTRNDQSAAGSRTGTTRTSIDANHTSPGSYVHSARGSGSVESAGVAEYLNNGTRSNKMRKIFKKKPMYYQSLELTRKDMARHEQVLDNIVNVKELEIEQLVEELENERMQNKGLITQLERERRFRTAGEVKSSNESGMQKAREQLKLTGRPKGNTTLFKWREV